MMQSRNAKQGWGAAMFLAAGVFLLAVYILPALANESSSSSSSCATDVDRRPIANGRNPGGRTWRVTASIQGTKSCETSLLGWQFFPSGEARGSWSGRWSIPTGGHLSSGSTISARDEFADASRAFSGIVGGAVTTVVIVMRDGNKRRLRPQVPPRTLTKNLSWLRNTRYFMHFYPAEDRVQRVRLLDSEGNLEYSTTGQEGSFEGPMGSP